jgi:hypothetical protein
MSDTPPTSGVVAREERYRLAALATGAPMILLVAPLILPFDDGRSLLESLRRHIADMVILILIFGWPLFVGAVSLRGALARRAPGTAAYAVPAVPHLIAAGLAVLLLFTALLKESSAAREPGVWAALIGGVLVLYLLARGFRRTGWGRWTQLIAGMWVAYASCAALFLSVDRRGLLDPPALGTWIFLFALSAAAPGVGWALWPRRP